MCRLPDIRPKPETHQPKFKEHLFNNPRCNQLYGVLKVIGPITFRLLNSWIRG